MTSLHSLIAHVIFLYILNWLCLIEFSFAEANSLAD